MSEEKIFIPKFVFKNGKLLLYEDFKKDRSNGNWPENLITPIQGGENIELNPCMWHSGKFCGVNNYCCDTRELYGNYAVWDAKYNCRDLCWLRENKEEIYLNNAIDKFRQNVPKYDKMSIEIEKLYTNYLAKLEEKNPYTAKLKIITDNRKNDINAYEEFLEDIPRKELMYKEQIRQNEQRFERSKENFERTKNNLADINDDSLRKLDEISGYTENKEKYNKSIKELEGFKSSIDIAERNHTMKMENYEKNIGKMKVSIRDVTNSSKSLIPELIYKIKDSLNEIDKIDFNKFDRSELISFKSLLAKLQTYKGVWNGYLERIKSRYDYSDEDIEKIYLEYSTELQRAKKDRENMQNTKSRRITKGQRILDSDGNYVTVVSDGTVGSDNKDIYLAGTLQSEKGAELPKTVMQKKEEEKPEDDILDVDLRNLEAEEERKEREHYKKYAGTNKGIEYERKYFGDKM